LGHDRGFLSILLVRVALGLVVIVVAGNAHVLWPYLTRPGYGYESGGARMWVAGATDLPYIIGASSLIAAWAARCGAAHSR
jgi:hypothetical protein